MPLSSTRRPLREVGRTSNTAYSVAADDILIVHPEQGLRDDAASARENMAFQTAYARSVGKPIAVVVLLSSLTSQDGDARRIYADGMDPRYFYASALVVSSPLARAIGSFFLGLTKPKSPTALFEGIDQAIAWAESHRPSLRARA